MTPNIRKLNVVNITPSVWLVRNDCTRLWSPMRCSRSPISFVSKNDMGSFSSLMKKSLTNEMLMRIEICNSSQRRMKSVDVRPMTIISSPSSISQINLISWCLIPKSTIACVRKGRISCSRLPTSSPKAICTKHRRYCFR